MFKLKPESIFEFKKNVSSIPIFRITDANLLEVKFISSSKIILSDSFIFLSDIFSLIECIFVGLELFEEVFKIKSNLCGYFF